MPGKLTLSAETLRVLADDALAGVKGAKTTGKGKCNKSGRKKKGRGC